MIYLQLMTAIEKVEVYRFLKTAHAWVSGFRNHEIEPEFSDSPVLIPRIPALIIGKPLSNEAQTLLNKMLAAIDLEPSKNCFIALLESITTQLLEEEINTHNPYAILMLGKDFMIDIPNKKGVANFQGIPALAIENPEDIIRNPELKRPAWEDLKIFKAQLNRLLAGDI